ncbi:DNA polymerase III subunit alpha [Caulobacter sp. SLTY]|uniref:error-prone DNA polymerase n=1 Tax=Caulobacter sp. SLTY TaxID=2683262 RepID=UPI00141365C4|nr:error-prone DNA polymerase [Caulobacter sp. SLTY]NBB17422.1 DNA polymerase III subunit alpha [Caulobacter sp. SLTY]
MTYAELDAVSNFSFLEGGSHPGEMVEQAQYLGLAAIGIADRNTLAGIVRAHSRAKQAGMRLLVGSRLVFTDESPLIVYPRGRAAYGRLCRLLSLGKSEVLGNDEDGRTTKGECRLTFDQAAAHGEGLVAIAPAPRVVDAAFAARLRTWARAWPDRLYLGANPLSDGRDRARLGHLARLADSLGIPMVATNAALYHHYARRPLQDVLTCIREGTTIDAAGFRLQVNAERYLKSPAEMARLFRGHERALARGLEIVEACRFSLEELAYHYPAEPVPSGKSPDQHLADLAWQGARWRFPRRLTPKIRATIDKELRIIARQGYAHYFLTVHDVVKWAREQGILCQGRGSAANSVVCYCLGITSVNPDKMDLLFERFVSEERKEPPDIDVDFEHERREEVIQYIYRRYGRARAAICATVIHYRPRSAIREVGKALGLTEDVTGSLAGTVWGSWGSEVEDGHAERAGVSKEEQRMRLALDLTRELIGFPRHLSQHVGGFVLTQGPLVEMVPVGNAAMDDRTFIEWDKDDIDELKIMKVDVLALGMLTAIRKGFDLIERFYGRRWDLASVLGETDETPVYDMLCRADSLGVFQVESRAQMAMLPRLRPRVFYDLVVEVAIVRPGPIQGNMVHPYLAARTAKREAERKGLPFEIAFPKPAPPHDPDELKNILNKTLGVPLFQEQAMRIAMEAAEFTGDEANGLRRAMATFRHNGTIGNFEEMLVGRLKARGYDPEFAENCFAQIRGFGEYGFPESHAASFALLVYVSAWMKCVHPDVFCAALLNSQPMGFYAPAQLVRDAREHQVEVRHPDINASDWDCTLEPRAEAARCALRLGLRQIDGFREDWGRLIMKAREAAAFTSIDDLRMRATLPARALELLAASDALGSLDLSRRGALWAARGLPRSRPLPLFAQAGVAEEDGPPPQALPATAPSEEVVQDYETIRLSLKDHPLTFLRERLATAGAIACERVNSDPPNRKTAVGGVVLVRQRPGTAKGVCFITLEDETGVANIVVWPSVFEAFRPVIMSARMILVRGRLQRAEGVTHLVAESIEDWTWTLGLLSAAPLRTVPAHGDEATSSAPGRGDPPRHRHPRDVRVLPKSRDFH